MKNLFVVLSSCCFLILGGVNISKQIKQTNALDEIVGFISLVKTEVRYHSAEYIDIYHKAKCENYKYLSFEKGEIYADRSIGEKCIDDFKSFVRKIGTTDEQGQLAICDEYKDRFDSVLNNRKNKEKERLQVNVALSVLGAITVLIFFM